MTTAKQFEEAELLRFALIDMRKCDMFSAHGLRVIARAAQRHGYLPDAVAFAEAATRRES
jgi:hypothetical protein